MYTRRFFLATLLAPLPFIAFAFFMALSARDDLYTHLMLTLLIPYTAFVAATYFISRNYTPAALRRFAPRGPLVFLFFLIGYLLLEFVFGVSIATTPTGLIAVMVFSATYVVILGYLYVLVMEQAYISYIYQQKEKHTHKHDHLAVDGKLRC